ncbi:MAG: hypothetical protein M3Y24_03485 [Acidobacteriota bacterium]|nr:hypothetical protein [Acidobacteriota bacterium]
MLFRDDQLFTVFPPSNLGGANPYLVARLYQADQNVTQLTSVLPDGAPSTGPNSAAVTGRFLTEAKSHLAYLYSAGNSLRLQLSDGVPNQTSSPLFMTTLTNYAGPKPWGDAVGMAAGDLDNAVDKNGMRHDELVVAYRNTTPVAGSPVSGTDPYNITLEVIDFSAWDGRAISVPGFTASSSPEVATIAAVPHNGSAQFGSPNYMGLSVATGDFDGDGKDEIALTYISDHAAVISVYRYQTDQTGHHTLSRLSSTAVANVPAVATNDVQEQIHLLPQISTATGDFDGNGINEQLALARVCAYDFGNSLYLVARLVTISFDLNYQPVVGTEFPSSGFPTDFNEVSFGKLSDPPLNYMKVQVVSGLFQFAPTAGGAPSDFNFRRRELALVFNSNNTNAPGLIIHPFWAYGGTLSDLLSSTPAYLLLKDLGTTNSFTAAVGGFGGVANAQAGNPLSSLAISSWFESGDKKAKNNNFSIDLLQFGGSSGLWESGNVLVHSEAVSSNGDVTAASLPLAAYDYEGKSVYLGAPVHITAPGIATTDFVIQEPPKHTYYDETSQSVVNVNRFDAFNSSLVDTTGSSLNITKQNTYGSSVGVSGAVSASATIGGGLDIGIAGASATVTTDLNASVNYDQQATSSQLNTQYGTYNYSIAGITNHDDYIARTTQDFDIWRYRVYGGGQTQVSSSGAALNNYVDFVAPGPYHTDYVFGLNYDDYQPIQENGNILSYPKPNVGGTYLPSDMGSFCLPSTDPDCSNPVFGPITAPASFQYGGGSTSFDLTFGSTTTNEGAITSSNDLKDSTDIKVTVAAKAAFLGNQGNVKASVEAGRTSDSSWTHSTTATTKFNQTTELKGNAVPGDSGHSYAFYPVMYSAQDGTMKLAYGAKLDDPENPAWLTFWKALYGSKPDPALNLPWRFKATYPTPFTVVWTPTIGLQRKQIRGFWLRKISKNPAGGYDYFTGAQAPTDGNRVQIEVRVYNYSLFPKPIGYLDVQYEIAKVDTSFGIAEVPFTSCPNSDLLLLPNGRCKISNSYIRNLGPQASTTTGVPWNTAGFGSADGTPQQYLIFVVLDKSNIIDEIYDSEAPNTTDVGQNNEGWGLVTVMSSNKSAKAGNSAHAKSADVVVDANAPLQDTARDLSMGPDSLGAIDTAAGRLSFDEAQVYAGQPISIRIGTRSDKVSSRINHVKIYDGNPSAGGKLIAIKNVQPGAVEKPSFTWFDWVPIEPGRHTLYAEVQESPDDTQPGNNVTKLEVLVAPFRTAAKR